MATLWRALALAWLGGVASPALMDEAAVARATVEYIATEPLTADVALRPGALDKKPLATAAGATEEISRG
jgi:hypothetical protein